MPEFDPFDEAPNDTESKEETVLDNPPAEAKKAPAKKAAVKAAVSGSDEGKIVLTFKEGAGFDSSWTVVHANTVAEANAILSDPEFKELLDKSKKVAGYYRGGSAGSGGGSAPQRTSNGAPPRGSQEPPAGAPPAPGPDWVYKSGVKKNGQGTWQGWMPPRGSDAKPLFFD